MSQTEQDTWGVAIVGMAGRFPGASNVDELWQVLVSGTETIRDITEAELREHELDFANVATDPAYVPRRGILDNAELFDASFFGIGPREASLMDPQQRIWLEAVWEALEDAALAPEKFGGKVGVFGGSYINGYLLYNLCRDRDYIEKLVRFRAVDAFQVLISNDKDYLPTRTSYKLNLTGPSVNVQTACSTSLVAVCQAVKSLLNHEADACIAGGICVPSPQYKGHLYQEGGMVSKDGRCRPFDADASGTVFSAGVGVVVLKRLEDALADGDNIRAVIKGVAVNNDGANKVSFTAPSVDGQAEVIGLAQAMADIDPTTISYIEAHGTATPLGDPIEVAALTKAFRMRTDRTGFCGLGSVKSNLGHLDAASGVAGLIKTVLSMEHRTLPPTLHYRAPNPEIDFVSSPFVVVDRLREWEGPRPLRAGVSSFGVGGTNAHVVLEEAPARSAAAPDESWHVLPLSARTETALARRSDDLRSFLDANGDVHMPSLARTLQEGRADFVHRRVMVCRSPGEASLVLSGKQPGLGGVGKAERTISNVAFMFPGQGAQHPGMGRELYDDEPIFRAAVDRCCEELRAHIGVDLREILFPAADQVEAAADALRRTEITQPALLVIELATAELWRSLGVTPAAMAGHSIGEYAAACVAGVMTEHDALRLVAERGRLMGAQPPGSMLGVRMPEADLLPRLGAGVELAAVNAPGLCVVSGPHAAVAGFRAALLADGIESTELHTSHAFHSAMMDPALKPFFAAFDGVVLSAPRIPFISCVTGTWVTPAQAQDPAYWVAQLRSPVLFRAGLEELATRVELLLEAGPGRTLATFARQCVASGKLPAVASLPHPREEVTARAALLRGAGLLWAHGFALDWTAVRRGAAQLLRVPTYPFERQRYWIEPPGRSVSSGNSGATVVIPVETNALATPTAQPVVDVKSIIATELITMVKELSGIEFDSGQTSTTFIELGLDSLFLTQMSAELNNRFGVRVKFRQLFEDISTVELLAEHIHSAMTPERAAALVPAPAVVPAASSPAPAVTQPGTQPGTQLQAGTTGESALERLVQEQLRVMQMQLETFRQAAPAAVASVSSPRVEDASAIARTADRDSGIAVPAAYAAAPASGRFGPYKQIERARDGGLTPVQEAHLARLVASLTARTPKSKRIAETFRSIQADPRSIASFRRIWKEMVYQIVATESKGSRIRDVDGNEYVDVTMGFGINLFGHSPDWIRSAIEAQLERGFAIGPQGELAGEVATMLAEFTGHDRVSFCNTGSEAVMAAMRMARTVTGRDLVVYFAGDYHGVFDEVLARPQVVGDRVTTAPIAPGIPHSSVGNIVVLEYGNPASLEILRSISDRVAAVLVEPVQSRHPELRPVEFVKELRALTIESGSALIFDEVITGFRTHPGGMQAVYGVRADLAAYGKIIGGGLPIGAVAGSARFMDTLDGGPWTFGDDSVPESDVTFFAGTFVRHPLALAAAKSVLTHLREQGPQLQEQLNRRTGEFADRMNVFFEDAGVPIRVRQYSSWFRFDFPPDLVYAPLLFFHMLERGVYVREPGQNCFFSTAHSDADIEFVAQTIIDTTADLQQAGFLPGRPVLADLPLTSPQQEIRVTSALGTAESCAFNECFQIRLGGGLDRDAFQRAVHDAVGRHEALRMRFDEAGMSQTVGQRPPAPDFVDLSALPAEERSARMVARIRDEQETAFDLIAGPPIRSQLIALGEEDHLFLCTAHHIVFDGWSSAVLIHDIRDGYNAYVRGRAPELVPAERFGSFVLDEGRRDEEAGEDVEYWRTLFADVPQPLELPVDRPRSGSRRFEGDTFKWEFSADAYDAARRLSRSSGVTLYCTMLSAYYALLHKLTGQEDLVVGFPVAGQSITDREHLVGHCLNLLPLRIRMRSTDSFADLLGRVRSGLLDAREHQTVSMGAIVREVNPPRDPARLPIVEVIFNLDRRLPGLDFEGITASVEECGKRSANFDLFLNLNEVEGETQRLTLNLDYSRQLFDVGTIARWVRDYEELIVRAAEDPGAPLRDVTQSGSNHGGASEVRGASLDLPGVGVDELIIAGAAGFGERCALVAGDESISYRELVDRVNALAARLIADGVMPGDRIGLVLDRSVGMVVALLASLRAGAAYVPLDPEFPIERLRFMVADSGLQWLVTRSGSAEDIAGADVRVITLDDIATGGAAAAVPSRARANEAAYIIYTSGSTGTPKGVIVPHEAVVNFLLSMQHEPGIDRDDRLLAVTTLSFDIAVLELLLPLTVGATVVIASADDIADAHGLRALVDTSLATVMQATPTLWRSLVEAGWRGGKDFRCLCGGEPLASELAAALLDRAGDVWNMYGPTETTIWSTCHRLDPADSTVRIGHPIANTWVAIVDSELRPVPRGTTGEIVIGGRGVALGYHGREELARERFVSDPATPSASARMYRTGDLGRLLTDDTLEHRGRSDNQIKIRGFRVELGEIETAITESELAQQAVVVVQRGEEGDDRLVAFLVSSAALSSAETMRSRLGERLPGYMIPSHYVELDSFPLTLNGKVDRTALVKRTVQMSPADRPYLAPRTASEAAVAAMFGEVLRVERVGAEDNFFDLGGHSILAMRVTAGLRERGAIHLSLRDLFQAPVVSGLAARIDELHDNASAADADQGMTRERLVF
jgi:amino acid adenylation domain-containing protein